MKGLPDTKEIGRRGEYLRGKKDFFKDFSAAWDLSRCQILKLETRQYYEESGNPSFETLKSGELAAAIEMLPEVKKVDDELYLSLAQRKVEFVRCRPLKFPLSDYLKWEMAAYEINSRKGERVFCCNYEQIDDVFLENASHDFMVFDARIAFIYDQDDIGTTVGGWRVTDNLAIEQLIGLFGYIRAHCRSYEMFKPK